MWTRTFMETHVSLFIACFYLAICKKELVSSTVLSLHTTKTHTKLPNFVILFSHQRL